MSQFKHIINFNYKKNIKSDLNIFAVIDSLSQTTCKKISFSWRQFWLLYSPLMPVSIAAWPLLVPQKIRSVSHQSGKRAFYLFLFRQVLRPVVIFLQISSYARVTVCLGKNWWIRRPHNLRKFFWFAHFSNASMPFFMRYFNCPRFDHLQENSEWISIFYYTLLQFSRPHFAIRIKLFSRIIVWSRL